MDNLEMAPAGISMKREIKERERSGALGPRAENLAQGGLYEERDLRLTLLPT